MRVYFLLLFYYFSSITTTTITTRTRNNGSFTFVVIAAETTTTTPSNENENECRENECQDNEYQEHRELDNEKDDDDDSSLCEDEHEDCEIWADSGECEKNPNYMLSSCKWSCGNCDDEGDDDEDDEEEEVWDDEEDCIDEEEQCAEWAEIGECESNPGFMLVECRNSCGSCFVNVTKDTDFGVEQVVEDEITLDIIQNSIQYMKGVRSKIKYAEVRKSCNNKDERCSQWAAEGECDNNIDYMITECAPACQTCEALDINYRCSFDMDNAVNSLQPGDLDVMFQRFFDDVDGEFEKYQPTFYSIPRSDDFEKQFYERHDGTYEDDDDEDEEDEDDEDEDEEDEDDEDDEDEDEEEMDGSNTQRIAKENNEPIDGPWIVSFDNFLTEEECDRLVEFGATQGYERSEDVGARNDDGTHEGTISEGRTSTNAWCNEECKSDPIISNVLQRMSHVTGISQDNSEDLQLLRYEVGQFYNEHHDYIGYQKNRPCGVRILTFFLYLNDVEEGGGTRFPLLDITVMPKKGKALLWPSVFNGHPDDEDPRTNHEALPVESGLKFGANAWIHMRDWVSALRSNCHN